MTSLAPVFLSSFAQIISSNPCNTPLSEYKDELSISPLPQNTICWETCPLRFLTGALCCRCYFCSLFSFLTKAGGILRHSSPFCAFIATSTLPNITSVPSNYYCSNVPKMIEFLGLIKISERTIVNCMIMLIVNGKMLMDSWSEK